MLFDFMLPISATKFGVNGKYENSVIPKVSSLWNLDKWLVGVHWKNENATFGLIFVKHMIIMIDFLNMVYGFEVFDDITDRENATFCLTFIKMITWLFGVLIGKLVVFYMEITQKIQVDGEVNKARCIPQNPEIISAKTSDCNKYNWLGY